MNLSPLTQTMLFKPYFVPLKGSEDKSYRILKKRMFITI